NPNTNRKRPRNFSNIFPLATTSNKTTKAVLGNTSTSIRIQASMKTPTTRLTYSQAAQTDLKLLKTDAPEDEMEWASE
ncbi:28017_t:CDS:1, partial [Dentiscutata erythropus]